MTKLPGLLGLGGLGHTPPPPKLGPPLPRGLLSETMEEATERRTKVHTLIREVFQVAVDHLGAEEARAAWQNAAKGRPGRRKGTTNADRDRMLLEMYDAVLRDHGEQKRKLLPRAIAQFVKKTRPDMFPATEQSVEMLIRRLLKNRKARAIANNALLAQFLLKPMSQYGLLGNLMADAEAPPDPTQPGETQNPGD